MHPQMRLRIFAAEGVLWYDVQAAHGDTLAAGRASLRPLAVHGPAHDLGKCTASCSCRPASLKHAGSASHEDAKRALPLYG